MTDIFSKSKRSQIMASISGKETKPEIMVRSFLFKNGYRFRKNVKTLPGKPDIVLPKYNSVIFVNGCFWHGHKNCSKAARPSSNSEFWVNKITGNIDRDAINKSKLKELGWKVIVLWECQLNSVNKRTKTFASLLRKLSPG